MKFQNNVYNVPTAKKIQREKQQKEAESAVDSCSGRSS